MSRRRDELKALFAGEAGDESRQPAPERKGGPVDPSPATGGEGTDIEGQAGQVGQVGQAGEPTRAEPPARSGSGAVRAMKLQLGALKAGAEEARALRESVARGERVVEIDPARIDPAFLADRFDPGSADDDTFEALKDSIARDGQQVPVLLRPHPDPAKAEAGRYQSAYGHRRIAAARALGLKVRAVVRPLTDTELVLAQGQENSERRALSFIERALFAKAMLDRGFERAVAQAALGIEKAEMSRLTQVAAAVPEPVVRAIGPAPKAGRGRWMELARHLENPTGQARANHFLGSRTVRAMPSDQRFSELIRLFSARGATARKAPSDATSVQGADGREIATLKRARRGASLTLSDGDFATFLANEMPTLHERFLAGKAAETGGD